MIFHLIPTIAQEKIHVNTIYWIYYLKIKSYLTWICENVIKVQLQMRDVTFDLIFRRPRISPARIRCLRGLLFGTAGENMEKRLKISQINVRERTRKDYGHLKGLANSIKRVGLLQAIGVTKNDYELVFGERRLKAVKMNGDKFIDCRILDIDNILEAEEHENEFRTDLTKSEKHALAEKLEAVAAKKERRGGTGSNQYQKKKSKERQVADNSTKHKRKTSHKIAAKSGFGSDRERRRVKTVMEKGIPEVQEAMDKGDLSVSAASRIAGKPKKQQRQFIKKHTNEENGKVKLKKSAKANWAVIWTEKMDEIIQRVFGVYEEEEGNKYGGVEGMMNSSLWSISSKKEKTNACLRTIEAAEQLSRLADDMQEYLDSH